MSEKREGQTVISIDELLTRASQLRDQIEAVSATLNTYLTQYRELQLAFETIKNLPEEVPHSYVVVDRLSMVLIPSRISDNWASNILVNLGLGYYMKTSRDKAMEILQKRLREVEKIISDVQSQHQRLLREYVAIQRIVNQVIEAQQSTSKSE